MLLNLELAEQCHKAELAEGELREKLTETEHLLVEETQKHQHNIQQEGGEKSTDVELKDLWRLVHNTDEESSESDTSLSVSTEVLKQQIREEITALRTKLNVKEAALKAERVYAGSSRKGRSSRSRLVDALNIDHVAIKRKSTRGHTETSTDLLCGDSLLHCNRTVPVPRKSYTDSDAHTPVPRVHFKDTTEAFEEVTEELDYDWCYEGVVVNKMRRRKDIPQRFQDDNDDRGFNVADVNGDSVDIGEMMGDVNVDYTKDDGANPVIRRHSYKKAVIDKDEQDEDGNKELTDFTSEINGGVDFSSNKSAGIQNSTYTINESHPDNCELPRARSGSFKAAMEQDHINSVSSISNYEGSHTCDTESSYSLSLSTAPKYSSTPLPSSGKTNERFVKRGMKNTHNIETQLFKRDMSVKVPNHTSNNLSILSEENNTSQSTENIDIENQSTSNPSSETNHPGHQSTSSMDTSSQSNTGTQLGQSGIDSNSGAALRLSELESNTGAALGHSELECSAEVWSLTRSDDDSNSETCSGSMRDSGHSSTIESFERDMHDLIHSDAMENESHGKKDKLDDLTNESSSRKSCKHSKNFPCDTCALSSTSLDFSPLNSSSDSGEIMCAVALSSVDNVDSILSYNEPLGTFDDLLDDDTHGTVSHKREEILLEGKATDQLSLQQKLQMSYSKNVSSSHVEDQKHFIPKRFNQVLPTSISFTNTAPTLTSSTASFTCGSMSCDVLTSTYASVPLCVTCSASVATSTSSVLFVSSTSTIATNTSSTSAGFFKTSVKSKPVKGIVKKRSVVVRKDDKITTPKFGLIRSSNNGKHSKKEESLNQQKKAAHSETFIINGQVRNCSYGPVDFPKNRSRNGCSSANKEKVLCTTKMPVSKLNDSISVYLKANQRLKFGSENPTKLTNEEKVQNGQKNISAKTHDRIENRTKKNMLSESYIRERSLSPSERILLRGRNSKGQDSGSNLTNDSFEILETSNRSLNDSFIVSMENLDISPENSSHEVSGLEVNPAHKLNFTDISDMGPMENPRRVDDVMERDIDHVVSEFVNPVVRGLKDIDQVQPKVGHPAVRGLKDLDGSYNTSVESEADTVEIKAEESDASRVMTNETGTDDSTGEESIVNVKKDLISFRSLISMNSDSDSDASERDCDKRRIDRKSFLQTFSKSENDGHVFPLVKFYNPNIENCVKNRNSTDINTCMSLGSKIKHSNCYQRNRSPNDRPANSVEVAKTSLEDSEKVVPLTRDIPVDKKFLWRRDSGSEIAISFRSDSDKQRDINNATFVLEDKNTTKYTPDLGKTGNAKGTTNVSTRSHQQGSETQVGGIGLGRARRHSPNENRLEPVTQGSPERGMKASGRGGEKSAFIRNGNIGKPVENTKQVTADAPPAQSDLHVDPEPVICLKPVSMLSKIRENHLARRRDFTRQTKMPQLSELTEKETAADNNNHPSKKTVLVEIADDVLRPPMPNSDSEIMPSIPDEFLQKLGLIPDGKSSEELSEQEIESKFTSLSLAFKTDSQTLEKRLEIQERSRDIAEQNVDKELKGLRNNLDKLNQVCTDPEVREVLASIQTHINILEKSTARVSSRAEVFGAIQQEKRMSKAVDIMVHHVENIRRVHEREHAELEEARKLLQDSRSLAPTTMDLPGGGDMLSRRSVSVCQNNMYSGKLSPTSPLSLGGFSPTTAKAIKLLKASRRRVSEIALPKVLGGTGAATLHPSASMDMSYSDPRTSPRGPPFRQESILDDEEGSNIHVVHLDVDQGDQGDARSRFQAAVAHTSMKSAVANTLRKASLEKQGNVRISPTPTPPHMSRENSSDSSAAKVTDVQDKEKQKNMEEEAFKKGYEQGLRANLGQDLSSLREQQNNINESLGEIMDSIDSQMEEPKSLREIFVEKFNETVPKVQISGWRIRVTFGCFFIIMAIISVIISLFPVSSASVVGYRHYGSPVV
ncbi:uncharacterized protein LOC128239309 isoform X2 [Mya arenaria]|uniref:uncharacterized protein LOC128239309 isoform X2 n=1 Tax=Mya arenaria TaxID=6604 RepID=UPI0022E05050|nr:uncharacterized protein LOC128239309 isoform X2 [Mya arenaria]